jgi:translation initiation factor 1
LTTVEGLPKDVDPKKVLKVFKKDFACNGSIVQDEDSGMDIIQLQGDHRQKVSQLLIEGAVCKKDDIQIHGF